MGQPCRWRGHGGAIPNADPLLCCRSSVCMPSTQYMGCCWDRTVDSRACLVSGGGKKQSSAELHVGNVTVDTRHLQNSLHPAANSLVKDASEGVRLQQRHLSGKQGNVAFNVAAAARDLISKVVSSKNLLPGFLFPSSEALPLLSRLPLPIRARACCRRRQTTTPHSNKWLPDPVFSCYLPRWPVWGSLPHWQQHRR